MEDVVNRLGLEPSTFAVKGPQATCGLWAEPNPIPPWDIRHPVIPGSVALQGLPGVCARSQGRSQKRRREGLSAIETFRPSIGLTAQPDLNGSQESRGVQQQNRSSGVSQGEELSGRVTRQRRHHMDANAAIVGVEAAEN